MQKKQLIEKLEDLATFFTLAQNDAEKRKEAAKKIGNGDSFSYHEGKELAYKVAFDKVDGIIKEAKG